MKLQESAQGQMMGGGQGELGNFQSIRKRERPKSCKNGKTLKVDGKRPAPSA
jgi:hypothetical protein